MEFNESLFMVIDLYPYEGYVSPNDPDNTQTYELGDVNKDGTINVSDVTRLISVVLSGADIDLLVADMDGNGSLTVADVTMLINYVLSRPE